MGRTQSMRTYSALRLECGCKVTCHGLSQDWEANIRSLNKNWNTKSLGWLYFCFDSILEIQNENCWISLTSWPQTRLKIAQKNLADASYLLLASLPLPRRYISAPCRKHDCKNLKIKMAGCLVFQPNKSQKLDEDQALHPGDEADIQCKPPLAFPEADTKAERMNFCSKNDHAKKRSLKSWDFSTEI